nr:hypothetical protein [uncultured Hyphomonas sp.]
MSDGILTKGNALKSQDVVGIIYHLLLGYSAARSAEKLRLDAGTVQKYFDLLRKRIAFHPSFFAYSDAEYPPREDPVWSAVLRCGFCEEGKTIHEDRTGPLRHKPFVSPDTTTSTTTYRQYSTLMRCESCPFEKPVLLRRFVYDQYNLEVAKSQHIDETNFYEFYFLFILRENIATNRTTENLMEQYIQRIIDILIDDPL